MKMIKADIKEPDGQLVKAKMGTPQGGIISPLLANVYLNCLDQWLSDQWECFDTHMTKPPKKQYSKNGERSMGNEYRTLRRSKLKEFAFVRYADDVVILCTSLQNAKKLKLAIQDFLTKDLKLKISEEKTKIVNLKKGHIKYLGFEIGTQLKGNKYVVESHMSKEAIKKEKDKLIDQVKKIQRPPTNIPRWGLINQYNSMVMGIHNYYQKATHISCDLKKADHELDKVVENRLHPTRKGKIEQKGLRKYSESDQVRYLEGMPLLPLGYVQTTKPMSRASKANIYTPEGAEWIQQYMNPPILLIQRYMLKHPIRNRSMEYNDNRISLVSGQHGKDKITGEPLREDWIDCHHIKPSRWR